MSLFDPSNFGIDYSGFGSLPYLMGAGQMQNQNLLRMGQQQVQPQQQGQQPHFNALSYGANQFLPSNMQLQNGQPSGMLSHFLPGQPQPAAPQQQNSGTVGSDGFAGNFGQPAQPPASPQGQQQGGLLGGLVHSVMPGGGGLFNWAAKSLF